MTIEEFLKSKMIKVSTLERVLMLPQGTIGSAMSRHRSIPKKHRPKIVKFLELNYGYREKK